MNARTTDAVPSGLSVIRLPPMSVKVYISLPTISESSPIDRSKRRVSSNTGVRISEYPKSPVHFLTVISIACQRSISPGRVSIVPFMACMDSINPIRERENLRHARSYKHIAFKYIYFTLCRSSTMIKMET